MNIVLTGATGTLGSQILFSLLEQKFERIQKIYVPVRKKATALPEQRIQNMLGSSKTPDFVKQNQGAISKKVHVVDAQEMLQPEGFLKDGVFDYFIHSAGYVNLSTSPEAKAEIFKENFDFTKSIFNSYSNHIKKFVYISTAFSFGDIGGTLKNEHLQNHTGNYRNHYEASKRASEEFLLEQGKLKNIPVQILRPSVLGGNIEESPNFFISKYMVFYLFAKFFHNNTSKENIRFAADSTTGLNIVPTDYAANVIVKVLESDIEQLNIVHAEETNIINGITKVLEAVGFSNFAFTEEQISKATGFASKLEEFYYETIGVHLHPYLNSKPSEWDTTLLESILPMPRYNLEEYLMQTVAYAKAANFKNQKW